eukprot:gene6560-7605_t
MTWIHAPSTHAIWTLEKSHTLKFYVESVENAQMAYDQSTCQLGACEPGKGCIFKPRICESYDWCMESFCDNSYGCIKLKRKCYPDDTLCKRGLCNNVTKECEYHDLDPKPFGCKTAAVISTAIIAANQMSAVQSNPLYVLNKRGSGDNPLYDNPTPSIIQ